jgi:hypothetical protein
VRENALLCHTAGCAEAAPLTPSGSGRVCAAADVHTPPSKDDHEESDDDDDEASSPMLTSISKAAWMPARANTIKDLVGFRCREIEGQIEDKRVFVCLPHRNI